MTHPNDKIPQLFANCILVKGASRSLICDVQRLSIHFIPDALYTILSKHKRKTVTFIKAYHKNEFDAFIDEYFDFLIKEDLIFFTNTPSNYPKMDLKWEEPFLITNAIIDIDETSDLNFLNIFIELDAIFCRNIQVRCFTQKNIHFFDSMLAYLMNKRITNVEILTPFDDSFSESAMNELCQKHKRLSILTLFAAAENRQMQFRNNTFGHVFLTRQMIDSKQHCGAILSDYFTINIKTFTEAQQHNTCLNRKISIDTEGYIRNCPSMPEHYGNIRDTTLQEAMQHPDFKKYWFINKDQISVCKDCEFRYICTDCRAYRENPDDLYSKPLKCGYNPYTCEWEEWSTNPLKQKAIDYYGMREMVENK